jgi:hypothetical protein
MTSKLLAGQGRLNGIIASLHHNNNNDEAKDDEPASKTVRLNDELTSDPAAAMMIDDDVDGMPTSTSVCGECNVAIRTPANIPVHMRRHIGYKPYSCSRCAYAGYDEDDVSRHASRCDTRAVATIHFSQSAYVRSLGHS